MPILPENCKMDSNRGGFELIYVGTPAQLNAVPSGMYTPAQGSLMTTVTDILNIDVEELDSIQVTLAPAPGVGKALQLISAVLSFDYVGTPYTAGVLEIRYTDGSGEVLSTQVTFAEFLDVEDDTILSVNALQANVALTANAAIVLDGSVLPASAAGASDIRVVCNYRVIEVA
jgi:hypothetical protein